jgi:hypothetical protein
MPLPTDKNNKCQNCGKSVSEELSTVTGDVFSLNVCKDCHKLIGRIGNVAWITVFVFIISWLIFMFTFPVQFNNMIAFFEKLLK